MSKAVLVFDMPSNCSNCCQSYDCYGEFYVCAAMDKALEEHKMDLEIPDWCPLKPLPEKIDVPEHDNNVKALSDNAFDVGAYMYNRGHYRGYNICIDAILGK